MYKVYALSRVENTKKSREKQMFATTSYFLPDRGRFRDTCLGVVFVLVLRFYSKTDFDEIHFILGYLTRFELV